MGDNDDFGSSGGNDDFGGSNGFEMTLVDDFDDSDVTGGPEGEPDLVTILVNGLQSIIDALQGNLTDDLIDHTGEEGLPGDIANEIPMTEDPSSSCGIRRLDY